MNRYLKDPLSILDTQRRWRLNSFISLRHYGTLQWVLTLHSSPRPHLLSFDFVVLLPKGVEFASPTLVSGLPMWLALANRMLQDSVPVPSWSPKRHEQFPLPTSHPGEHAWALCRGCRACGTRPSYLIFPAKATLSSKRRPNPRMESQSQSEWPAYRFIS